MRARPTPRRITSRPVASTPGGTARPRTSAPVLSMQNTWTLEPVSKRASRCVSPPRPSRASTSEASSARIAKGSPGRTGTEMARWRSADSSNASAAMITANASQNHSRILANRLRTRSGPLARREAHALAGGRPGSLGAAQDRANAGHQLARIEWLGHIVVGPHLEPDDAIHVVAARGEHQHRRLLALAQAAQHLEAAKPGQH